MKFMNDFAVLLDSLAKEVNLDIKAKGFWEDYEDYVYGLEGDKIPEINKAFKAQKIALMHSELSEALEADRKNEKDSHLPEYPGLWVELADTMIRILDFCGQFNIPIGEVLTKKWAYNNTREHKHGKTF